jgi:hypothetical protein
MLLAPTHEEEITALVNNDIVSEKALPARLFQIGTGLAGLTSSFADQLLQVANSETRLDQEADCFDAGNS